MPHESRELELVAVATRPQHVDRARRVAGDAGPGWFDSSWELRRGLEVRESWSDDDRVHGWIEQFLSARRAVESSTT